MEKHTNDPSIVSNILELDDILTRIFAAVIEVCPSAVGSTLLVSKKWHKNIRKRILWIKNPLLSHIAHENTEDLVSYSKLEEYILELKILEHSAEIKRALRKKKTAELRRRALITNRCLKTDVGELKTIMKSELQNIKGLTPFLYELIKEQSGWIKYDALRQVCGLTYRQMAVMLVLSTYWPDVLPSVQFDKWTGVNHLFKTRQQLEEILDVLGPTGQLKMKVATSSTISAQGLKRIKIFDTFDEEERLSFKRLYDNSYLLGCSESYSSLNVIDSFHVFISASWLTFLSDEHWIALFLLFEANQQTDVKPLIVVKGSTTSPEIEMFDLRERFKLREEEFSSNKANEAIKQLYEFSDEEWSKVPEPKYYHVLSVLSGLKRDFLHP